MFKKTTITALVGIPLAFGMSVLQAAPTPTERAKPAVETMKADDEAKDVKEEASEHKAATGNKVDKKANGHKSGNENKPGKGNRHAHSPEKGNKKNKNRPQKD